MQYPICSCQENSAHKSDSAVSPAKRQVPDTAWHFLLSVPKYPQVSGQLPERHARHWHHSPAKICFVPVCTQNISRLIQLILMEQISHFVRHFHNGISCIKRVIIPQIDLFIRLSSNFNFELIGKIEIRGRGATARSSAYKKKSDRLVRLSDMKKRVPVLFQERAHRNILLSIGEKDKICRYKSAAAF